MPPPAVADQASFAHVAEFFNSLLDRPAAKWNSYLRHGIHSDRQKQHQPTAIGEAMAHGLGLEPDKARRGQWI